MVLAGSGVGLTAGPKLAVQARFSLPSTGSRVAFVSSMNLFVSHPPVLVFGRIELTTRTCHIHTDNSDR